MGITGFFKFLDDMCPQLSTPIPLNEFKTKVTIDLNCILYKLSYGCKDGNEIILKVLRYYSSLLQNQIEPVFIMDGNVPYEEKAHINVKRKLAKDLVKKEC